MARQDCDLLLVFPPIRTWDSPRNFPMGPGLIAAEVRQAGYRVDVVDANGLRLTDEQVLAEIQEQKPAVVGIGGLITTYAWVKRLTRKIRELRPDMPIILGGSVGSSILETALDNLDIDVVTLGEADETILELLPALLNGEALDGIAGLAFRRDGKTVRTAERPLLRDLDKLPYPAWDLFPMDVYTENPVVGVGKDVDIISSRGCPFNCHYCYKIFGRKFRGRSAEHVVGEMEALRRHYDVDFVSIQDDCFVIDKERVYAVCDLIDRSKVLKGIRWSCNGRVTVCDLDLLKRIRRSGCVSVAYGIESGSQTILEAMEKSVTLQQAAEAIQYTRQAGLRSPLAFMIGYPGETRQTVMETVEFCKSLNIPLTSMSFTCPYPGTQLYRELRELGKLEGSEEELVVKMGDAVDLTVNLTDMGNEELISLRQEALDMVRESYVPPTAEEIATQEKELYGDDLYQKSQQQLRDPRMRAHRQRHGFNEGQRGDREDQKKEAIARVVPDWVNRQVEPYIIAEAGVNHNGQLSLALAMAEAAKKAGADCVKFQAFSARELTTRDAAKAEYQQACGDDGEGQYEMLKRYELTDNAFSTLKQRCDMLGIDFLATPFSTKWVDLLVKLGVSAVKVGSGNIGSGSLLDVIGQTGLPLVVSTGMCDMVEVDGTLARLRGAGCGEIALLHCVSLYPTPPDQTNLRAIRTLQEHTGLPTGFSDHTQEVVTGGLAVAMGATILEKHFTMDKEMDGPDHKVSLEPSEMAEYVELAHKAAAACGTGRKEPLAEELPVKKLVRLSVVSARRINAGTVITPEMLTMKRPGTGISAEQLRLVIGSTAKRDIAEDEMVDMEALEMTISGK